MAIRIDLIFKDIDTPFTPDEKKLIIAQAKSIAATENELVLKMEVKRLMSECPRIIDLRGKVDGECDFYDIGGVSHCMDEIAKEVFDQKFKLYRGYTMGVYEAVHQTENSFKVRYQKDIAEIKQSGSRKLTRDGKAAQVTETKIEVNYNVPSYCFAEIDRRKEERMNFLSALDLVTREQFHFEAKSVDLSLQGLRVKTEQEPEIKPGDKLNIHFTGLESQYVLDDINGEEYEVVNITLEKHEYFIGLKRTEYEEFNKVSNFLRELIRSLKPVRKVNVSHSLRALNIKGFEQYFTNATQTVPIFLELSEGQYVPRFILYNDTNVKSLHYWSNTQMDLCVQCALSDERINRGKVVNAPAQYIYSFHTVKNGESTFYTASQDELKTSPVLRETFLGYGSRQVSWRVYKLEVQTVQPEMCFRPLTTPNKKEEGDNNIPIDDAALKALEKLSYVALLTDVTEENASLDYQQYKVSSKALGEMKRYRRLPDRTLACVVLNMVDLENKQKLTKNPFPVRTQVELELVPKNEKGEKGERIKLEGVSSDISASALTVGVKDVVSVDVGQVILVSLPELDEQTNKHKLLSMPYEIVSVYGGGRFFDLKVFRAKGVSLHTAEHFFSTHLRTIAEKVGAKRKVTMVPDIGEALKNIFVNVQRNYSAYFKRTGGYRLPAAITRPKHEGAYRHLFSFGVNKKQLTTVRSVLPLFSANKYENHLITETLKSLPSKTSSNSQTRLSAKGEVSRELYIAFQPKVAEQKLRVISRLSSDFENSLKKREFIRAARTRGHFFALLFSVNQTGTINWENLKLERNYVRKNSADALSQFESELKRILGVVELVDVTDEVLQRLDLQKQPKQTEQA